MGYRIVKITSYYKDFISYYYTKYPDIINYGYSKQLHHLMKQRFAWSDAFAVAFRSIGNEAFEIVVNAESLQKKWCTENNIKTKLTSKEIVIKQLKVLKPDVVWFQDSYTFNGSFIERIKKEVPTIKIFIGNVCSPISPEYYDAFKSFDFIVVCALFFKHLLESKGLPQSIVVPHAFDSRILNETVIPEQKKYDFLFTGSIILDQNFHEERIRFIKDLLNYTDLDVNLMINLNKRSSKWIHLRQTAFMVSKLLKKTGLDIINQTIEPLNKVSKLQYFPRQTSLSKKFLKSINKPVFGIDMFNEIANSNIVFNIHGDIAKDFTANLRMFEVTGIGSCLLTDWKKDINNYFIDGEEIITYKSFDEAKEKIKWLTKNPEKMKAIAKKGQKKTLTHHTFLNRAKIIDDKITSLLRK